MKRKRKLTGVIWCVIVLTHELPWFTFLDFYGQAGRTFIPNCYHLPKAIRCCFLLDCIKHTLGFYLKYCYSRH
ncbi:hypothetical protein BDA96_06G018300 [Sorghum bicolor]|uniref:Uncharacterized protein n=2 Tax=Sorghum bicolor TaxID=4558 RepID=A0A921QQE4_SORBI|nr:hypothetical protein BDA96_06G018300 [Sorghum bicolor]OQU81145.1 hypothetical protein SORBI_3006G016950 [Sorghum bicolor]